MGIGQIQQTEAFREKKVFQVVHHEIKHLP
jgi:hypothetical protein